MSLQRRHFTFGAAALACGPLFAQVPTRQIRFIVGFSVGGAADGVTRVVAEHMARELGQTIIVENKPGAGGIIANDFVAKAPPDGSVILFGAGDGMIVSPIARGPSVPYDPFKDFTPITQMGQYTMGWYVPASLPVNNIQEFIAYVRARPGQLNFASGSDGFRLAGLQFFAQQKIDMLSVSFRGDAPALIELMANRVHSLYGALGAARPFLKEGRIKMLMIQAKTRSPEFPDVPTLQEAGATGIKTLPWSGIFGPAGMSPALTQRYADAYRAAVSSKEVRDKLQLFGFEPVPSTPQEMAALHRSEYDTFRKAVQDGIVKLE